MTAPPVVAPWSPACMDEAERVEWEAANARITGMFGAVRRADRPCTDCTLGFAADMRALGRCNGTPGGVEEEEPVDETRTIARIESAATTKVAIALAAPCGPCGHAPVCRLREAVEAMERTSVPVPKLETGLTVELRGSIACDWFAKAKAAPAAGEGGPKRGWTPEQRAAQAERARQQMAARKAAAGA